MRVAVGLLVAAEVGVAVRVTVAVDVEVDVGVCVRVGDGGTGVAVEPTVSVKKVAESTPQRPSPPTPCTSSRCRPAGRRLSPQARSPALYRPRSRPG